MFFEVVICCLENCFAMFDSFILSLIFFFHCIPLPSSSIIQQLALFEMGFEIITTSRVFQLA